ncbi:MAG: hypothetical protein JWM93_2652 [Frankiales bacterium]|nr:hypothetical protein [Frankiales bacterium]
MTKLATPMAEAQARALLEAATVAGSGSLHLDAQGRRVLEDLGLDVTAVDHGCNLLVARGQAELVVTRSGHIALTATDTGRATVTHLTIVRDVAA